MPKSFLVAVMVAVTRAGGGGGVEGGRLGDDADLEAVEFR